MQLSMAYEAAANIKRLKGSCAAIREAESQNKCTIYAANNGTSWAGTKRVGIGFGQVLDALQFEPLILVS